MYEYKCVITDVVDGDTIKVDLDLGFDVHKKERIRLARINAPEKKTPEGKGAKSFIEQLVGTKATIKTNKKDKYGRYIGELTVAWQGKDKNLSDIIVENGSGKYVEYK